MYTLLLQSANSNTFYCAGLTLNEVMKYCNSKTYKVLEVF